MFALYLGDMQLSEELELQRALSDCGKFLIDMSPPQASRDSIGGEPERPPRRRITVNRSDALDCFLKGNPKFERFRPRLSEVRSEEPTFTFDEAKWNQARA